MKDKRHSLIIVKIKNLIIKYFKINDIICWWSGGITSAVACYLAINLFGRKRCRIIFMDTYNEDIDTYRFKNDCEKWYGKKIEVISSIPEKYDSIQDIWYKFKSLNTAHGAICSTELKRELRIRWQKINFFRYQIFGFDGKECNRALALRMNYPNTKPLFILLMHGLLKSDCIKIIQNAKIEIPIAYKLGLQNNNCLKTGCVQGGIWYWQELDKIDSSKVDKMGSIEHELSDLKGKPVTICKDQSKEAKKTKTQLVFLRHNPKFPNVKDISMMKGRKPIPLFECNGFCGTNDLIKNN